MTPADQSQGSTRAAREARPHVYLACKKWLLRKKYESQKYEKKSPIHENADANITCDFGDGDISRLGVANQTHVVTNYQVKQFEQIKEKEVIREIRNIWK